MNWYLKHRPKNIKELGLTSVRQTLTKLLAGPEFPHAFLLAGPRGLGKTSTARIIAQYVNCQAPQEVGVPCGQCSSCQLFKQKTVVDVVEMDAASNRSVDDIRQLRSAVGLAPSQLKYKVYIIDEAHMLTREAFNALLKTLEEPPSHVIFILATTEIQKVPETIKSRCQIIEYHLATIEELVQTLKRVAKGEKLEVTDKDLKLIAARARGSFRDAIKIIERLAEKNKLNSQLLNQLAQADNLIDQLFTALRERDIPQSVRLLDKLNETSYPARDLIYQLEQQLNHLLSNYQQFSPKELSYYQQLVRLLLEASTNFSEPISTYLSLKAAFLNLDEGKQSPNPRSEESKKETKISPPTKSLSKSKEEKKKINSHFTLQEVKKVWSELAKSSLELNHGLKNILEVAALTKVDGNIIHLSVAYSLQRDLLEKNNIRQWLEKKLGQLLKQEQVGLIVDVDTSLRKKQAEAVSKSQTAASRDSRLDILMF